MPATARPATSSPGMRAMTAGGTSIAGSRRTPIALGVGAAVVVVVAVVIVIVSRGSSDDPAAEAPVDEVVDPGDEDTAESRPTPLPPGESRRGNDEVDLGEVASTMAAGLRGKRLWATVTVDRADPTVIVIRSSLCVDSSLAGEVTAYRAELRAAGATAVRCVAPHGGVMFEVTP